MLKARDQAASDGTPFAADDHLLVIRDWTAPGVGATATDPTVVGTKLTPSLICHEMGHFFQRQNHQPGGHASVFNGWISLDYVDGGCVMGGEGPTKFTFSAVPPPILNAHNVAGPAMSPAMVDLCGWLDKGNPGAVLDGTHAAAVRYPDRHLAWGAAARAPRTAQRADLRRLGTARRPHLPVLALARRAVGRRLPSASDRPGAAEGCVAPEGNAAAGRARARAERGDVPARRVRRGARRRDAGRPRTPARRGGRHHRRRRPASAAARPVARRGRDAGRRTGSGPCVPRGSRCPGRADRPVRGRPWR